MSEYKRLFKFMKPHMGLFSIASVFMVFSALFDGVSLTMILPLSDKILTGKKIILPAKLPSAVTGMVDALNNIAPAILLNYMIIAVIVLFVLKGWFFFMQGYLMNDVSQRVVSDLRSKLYAKLQTLSLDYFSARRGGELMSRITNDVEQIGNTISYGMVDLIYQSVQVVVFASLIFFIHTQLAIMALFLLPLICIPMIKVGKVLKKISYRSQEKMADINCILYETILGVRVVKAFNCESYEQEKFDRANHEFYKLFMKSSKRTLLLGPITEIIGICAAAFVLLWQGKQVIEGKISFGVLFVALAALLSMVRPFKKLSQLNGMVQQAVAASSRVYEILDTVPTVKEKDQPAIMPLFRDRIIFEHVNFSYGLTQVLKGINLDVKCGEIVAIVGPSGAGKTTLLDLIPRFYDPEKGRVIIDGRDIRDFSLKSLRQNIAIVTQETILFNDTVRANIAYGLTGVLQADIEKAAVQAHVHDVITRLPAGYDTFIGDRGTKLSGGERQRIAIARALLKNAPILILDEATSQLDSESERLVQAALNKLMEGRTVFIIAHRLSTVRNTSRIAVLNNGKIVELGTHDQLLKNDDGLYKKLYQNQSAHVEPVA